MAREKRSFPDKRIPLEVRKASIGDIETIQALSEKVYAGSGMGAYPADMLRGQINQFPEGQFVVVHGERVIAYCATFIISGDIALKPHSWMEITGGGYAARHDPDGDYLYGMEVCVDPEYRGFRIGQRLYNERKKLCQEWRLKGIVFGGRLPSLHRRIKQYDHVEAYVEAVRQKKHRDPVLSFQLGNGFEILGVLPDYLPFDRESMGYGVHLLWRNPAVADEQEELRPHRYGGHLPDTVRVAVVQYMQRKVNSFEEFLSIVEYFVNVCSDYKADFVAFPELFALQLLSIDNQELSCQESIESLTKYTPQFKDAFSEMALRYNVNIVGGTHPTRMESGRVENVCYMFLRDGRIHEQAKIHPTPNEVFWWNIEGGNTLQAVETDCGSVGVLICYDAEFPELARHLIDQGAHILFVPFCTDERQSYLRVRYCCQARAVENQCFVVMAGNVGNLPRVANMDIQYAQSAIFTPCDFPFDRDGIAAETTPNTEMVAFADLRIESLRAARNNGTVQNLKDRRHDLYRVDWRTPGNITPTNR
ncbi:MAG: GNAT family N-acetyltransferase [Verrucomicrobia bacterium]|nr:GNAT family N-acetyltransferase [Verrucomicrobiota bacterium]